jgi:o-succinylbenzoate---CoA ligase
MYKDIVFTDGIQEDYKQSVINFIAEWESYSPVLRVSTSGTTGAPKTIEFTKKQVQASARYTGRFFQFKKGDAVLLNLSPEFVAGKLMIVRALVHEMKLVVAPLQANPLEAVDGIDQALKLGAFVPYQVAAILKDGKTKSRFEKIENVLIGGAIMTPGLEHQVAQLKNKNYASFGMTETLTHFALRPIDGKTKHYTCLPGIAISEDERGCLVVEPNEILSERLVTNDCIRFIDPQNFEWIGRIDNVINSGGVKIFPEADEVLIHPLINARFYITSRKSETLGEEPVLVMEGTAMEMSAQEKLLEQIAVVLPKYHAPKSIILLSKLDETSNGKVKRQKY